MRRSWLIRVVPVAAVAMIATGAVAVPTGAASAASHGSGGRLSGFTPRHSRQEKAHEKAYLKLPSTGVAQRLDKFLSRKPGLVATSGDWRRVQYIARKFRSYGLRARVETYYTYLSIPKHIAVSETAPRQVQALTKEPRYPWNHDFKNMVVGYNALSPSGDVTAPAVYVNYGTVADYKTLAKKGISVKNKIVIARYGKVFRGVKVKLAARHGAEGVVLYSDPADDGYVKGTTYPAGPWRAPQGIQRGSIQELTKYAGDPLTPGYAATKNAHRIPPSKANLGKIPSDPIGYGSARPMLADLSGPKAPKSWQGGLPFTYHIGSGPTRVHLDLKIDYKIKPIWDITATIPGAVHPHQKVMLGAHHDTWTYGSFDNLSGTEAVMQVARGLGRLLKHGWRPNRTIVLASWDGEEYGLYGSTEYAEQRGAKGLRNVVGYINLDEAAGRDFFASGVPSLDKLIYQTTKLVHQPGTSTTIYGDWSKRSHGKPTIDRLGSGSDYTAFLDHFGVPAIDPGASTPGGEYHCACDNYYWMTHFGDPTWAYHKAMAQEVGLLTMRLADADIAQLRYAPYAAAIRSYLRGFQKAQHKQFGRQVIHVHRDIVLARAWQRAARHLRHRISRVLRKGASLQRYAAIDKKLIRDERTLLTDQGLPGRPWYKHQIYAPGVNSGYGTQELPGLHQALFLNHDRGQARHYERLLHRSLRHAAATLRKGRG